MSIPIHLCPRKKGFWESWELGDGKIVESQNSNRIGLGWMGWRARCGAAKKKKKKKLFESSTAKFGIVPGGFPILVLPANPSSSCRVSLGKRLGIPAWMRKLGVLQAFPGAGSAWEGQGIVSIQQLGTTGDSWNSLWSLEVLGRAGNGDWLQDSLQEW